LENDIVSGRVLDSSGGESDLKVASEGSEEICRKGLENVSVTE